MLKMLNDQINLEFYSSNIYLQMSYLLVIAYLDMTD